MRSMAKRAGIRWAVFAAVAVFCGSASAANVVLKDGTVIHGEIESLQNGVYTVRTDSLGTVRVRQKQVRSIDESGGAAKSAPAASSTEGASSRGAELQSIRQGVRSTLARDPQLMQLLLSLQNDPQMRAVLGDPGLMGEIAAGDYTALQNDPKMIALMHDSAVQAILGQLH